MNLLSAYDIWASQTFGKPLSPTQGGVVQIAPGPTWLTPDDCGKTFTDGTSPYWSWIIMPNALDCLGLPGITFKAARPLGGDRTAMCLTVYPNWNDEGSDEPNYRWFSVGSVYDLDALSPCNDGDWVTLAAQQVNEVRLTIGSEFITNQSPGQVVTGISSGFQGILKYNSSYNLIVAPYPGTPTPSLYETLTFDLAATESVQAVPNPITQRWVATGFKGSWDNRND